MSYIKTDKGAVVVSDYNEQVARGKVGGIGFVKKFGKTPSLSSGNNFEIWDVAGAYNWVTSGTTVTVTSSSAFDKPSDGAGAQNVSITGIVDGTYQINTEIVAMSGTSSGTYRRIFRAFVTDVGASGVNVGNVDIKHDTDIVARIKAGKGQTLMAIYTIPSGSTGYLKKWDASVVADDTAQVKAGDFELYIQAMDRNTSKRVKDAMGLKDGHHLMKSVYPIEISEMTDVWVEVTAKSNSTKCTGGFEIEIKYNESSNLSS